MVVHHAENAARREEMHFRAPLLAGAGHAQRPGGRAIGEFDLVHLAVAPDRQAQPAGECIDHRNADAVQAAGDLVGVLVEFAAGVKLGHHDFDGGALGLNVVILLDAGRDAAAVVAHRARAVGV